MSAIRHWSFRAVSLACAPVLAAGILACVPDGAGAAVKPASLHVQKTPSVPVTTVRGHAPRTDQSRYAAPKAGKIARPRVGVESAVSLGSGWTRSVEGLRLRATTSGAATVARIATVSAARVSAASTGDEVFRVSVPKRAAGTQVSFDLKAFAAGHSSDWASRVQLRLLGGCSVTGATVSGCDAATVLKASTDASTGELVAALPASAASRVVVLDQTTTDAGAQGDYSATSLSPSSSWTAGDQSGSFEWSYPITTPAAEGGPQPDLSISYDSGSVDGLTSATNNQSSWVGEGFDLNTGYIERDFEPCKLIKGSGAPATSGDLCWDNNSLTISFNGSSSTLVRVGASDQWKMQSDDGSTLTHVTDPSKANGDNDGEYWVLTDTDGTKYYFGINKRFSGDSKPTNSVSTVPVYATSAGQPCYNATFAKSQCQQAWRWGLDYVVDTHANTMTYRYRQETNKFSTDYQSTDKTHASLSYDRAAVLTSIEYGQKAGSENSSNAPAVVQFASSDRCFNSGKCASQKIESATASLWPDVPTDLVCTKDNDCGTHSSPAFFTDQRLSTITTKVLDNGSYKTVDSWALKQEPEITGDSSESAVSPQVMWLDSITRTGSDTGSYVTGSSVTLPSVKFSPILLENRVDVIGDKLPPFSRLRLASIDNGAGGLTTVTYAGSSDPNCTTAKVAALKPAANTAPCYPVFYDSAQTTDPNPKWTMQWFHKYVVSQVTDADHVADKGQVTTSYTYSGAAWHHDDSTTLPAGYRTWSQWRGFGSVVTQVGSADDLKHGTTTYTRSTYFQGMDRDLNADGGHKSVTVGGVNDANALAGRTNTTVTKVGPGDKAATVSSVTTTPWVSAATAGSGTSGAYLVGDGTVRTVKPTESGSQVSTVSNTFDSRGRVTQSVDTAQSLDSSGKVTSGDSRCTATTYLTDQGDAAGKAATSAGLFDLATSATTVASANCAMKPASQNDVISATKSVYDPAGDVTQALSASGVSGGVIAYQTDKSTSYDSYGRVTKVVDAMKRPTLTSYSPSSGIATTVTTTNAKSQVSWQKLDPGRGSVVSSSNVAGKVTTYNYDVLGRVAAVWLPGRSTAKLPTYKYSYGVTGSSASWAERQSLNSSGGYTPSVTFYDGLLRERETQTASASGSGSDKLVVEKRYDEYGRVVLTTAAFDDTSAPINVLSPVLVRAAVAADGGFTHVPSYTTTSYDLAGRVVRSELDSRDSTVSYTTTAYGGDRVTVSAPTLANGTASGGTKTTTLTDARGRKTAVWQYVSPATSEAQVAAVSGAARAKLVDESDYSYSPAGKVVRLVNAAGTKWARAYDVRGDLLSSTDADGGTTSYGYDADGEQTSSRDARGAVTATLYDALGRKTSVSGTMAGKPTEPVASWVYDTVQPGELSTSTSYDASGSPSVSTTVTGYSDAGLVTGQKTALPSSLGSVGGSYPSSTSYNVDGSVASTDDAGDAPGVVDTLKYWYNATGQVVELGSSQAGSVVRSASYSPTGQLMGEVSEPASGELRQALTYDDATGKLLTMSVGAEAGAVDVPSVAGLSWTYDAAGDVVSAADSAVGRRECFSYDYVGRLSRAQTTSGRCSSASDASMGSVGAYAQAYSYDKSGNRRTGRVAGLSGVATSSYAVGSGSQADVVTGVSTTTVPVSGGSSTSSTRYSYDAAGNMTGRGGWSYAYDAPGRADRVTSASGVVTSYGYDASGTRVWSRDSAGVTHVWLGQVSLTGSATGSGVSAEHTYSLGGMPVEVRSASRASGSDTVVKSVSGVVADPHGTVVASVSLASGVVSRRWVDPFGVAVGSRGTLATTRGFLDQPVTTDGLVSDGVRDYDPVLGRFTTLDPLFDEGDPGSWDGYVYANNSPVTDSDPSGLCNMFALDCTGRGHAPTPDGIDHRQTGDGRDLPPTSGKSPSSPSNGNTTSGSTGSWPVASPSDGDVFTRMGLWSPGSTLDLVHRLFLEPMGEAVQSGARRARDAVGCQQVSMGCAARLGIILGFGAIDEPEEGFSLAEEGEEEGMDSSLADTSAAAFKAADNVDDWTVSAKHLPNAGGRWNKWAAGVDINGTVASALRSNDASFLPDGSGATDRFIVRTDMGSVIGTRGQTYVKAVISNDGRVITAYPVK